MPAPAPDARSEPKTFAPLSEYEHPTLPTDETLRHAVERLRDRIFGKGDPDPLISEGRLNHTPRDRLDRIAAPPACGPVIGEMAETFAPWLGDPDGRRLQVVVLPPCETGGIVAAWAARAGLETLDAPARETLIGRHAPPDLDGEGVLVIPRLEEWVLRHREGLGALRALMQALAATERRCLVGCNTYAWAWLDRAVSLGLQLPVPLTFRPFDAERLRRWFLDLSRAAPGDVETFRLSTNGEDVLEADEDDEPANDFLRLLAARSHGIPWIAWNLWRDALRDTPDEDAVENGESLPEQDNDRTLWVAAPRDDALPAGGERAAMMVLHSLLIHGALTPDMLRRTLPLVGGTNVLPALIEAGFVARENGTVRCAAAAYPAIREALQNAGFPVGVI